MPHATAIITEVEGGYSVQTGPRTRSPKTYESFKVAYQNAAQYVGWNYGHVSVRIHPDNIQKDIDGVQNTRNAIDKEALEAKEKRELDRLQEKYPNEL